MKRTAQITYETGERSPSAEYLLAAGKVGVDVPFVLTGLQTTADSIERRALIKILDAIFERLGLDWISTLDSAYSEVEKELGAPRELLDYEIPSLAHEIEASAFDAINKIELNGALLTEVLEAIDISSEVDEILLPPAVKSDLAVMLYRAFRPTNKVDFEVVRQAFNLASMKWKSTK